MVFVMLNPSTADGTQDDPTIRRCVGFATSHGSDALAVVNLFGYRATDPTDLFARPLREAEGPDNRRAWRIARLAAVVVVAWGWKGKLLSDPFVTSQGDRSLFCLGVTKSGAPRHPLYVPRSTRLRLWEGGL